MQAPRRPCSGPSATLRGTVEQSAGGFHGIVLLHANHPLPTLMRAAGTRDEQQRGPIML